MAERQFRIGEEIKISKLETTLYTNVDVVVLEPLPKEAKINGSLIDNYVRIFNDTTQIVEIADTDIDSADSVGKFCVGSDGEIKLIITKDTYKTLEDAKQALKNYIVYYEVQAIEMIENMFVADVYDEGSKERLYPTKTLNVTDLIDFIVSYCRNLDLERGNEPFFKIKPATKLKE